jgi:hypothetical protein
MRHKSYITSMEDERHGRSKRLLKFREMLRIYLNETENQINGVVPEGDPCPSPEEMLCMMSDTWGEVLVTGDYEVEKEEKACVMIGQVDRYRKVHLVMDTGHSLCGGFYFRRGRGNFGVIRKGPLSDVTCQRCMRILKS